MARVSTFVIVFVASMLAVASSASANSTYAATVLANPSLVSFWRLNEQGAQTDAEGMTAADATGANPGVYHLGVNLGVPGSLEGDPDTAAHFGTPDGDVEIPYASDLNTSAFTIEGWVNPDIAAQYMIVAGNGAQQEDGTGYAIQTFSNYGTMSLDFWIGNGTTNELLSGEGYTPGQWIYFAATYDGTTARWYENGQLVKSMTTGYVPNSSLPTLIGLNPVNAATGQLSGSVDDLAVYDAALSAATIQQHYELGIDDGVPPQTSLQSAPSGETNQSSATFQFTSDSVDPTYQCQLDGGAWQSCSSPYQISGLADGQHEFAVRAVNRAGQVGPSPPAATWTVDTTPPTTSFTAEPPALINSTTATFSFVSATGSTFTCELDDGPAVPCSSPYTVSGLYDGPHMLAVQATDALGNLEAVPAIFSWSVDTAAPTTFITAAPTTQHPQQPFVFTANQSSVTFLCSVDHGRWEPCGSPLTRFPQTPGVHTFAIQATNALGSVDPSDHLYTWNVESLQLRLKFPRRVIRGSLKGERLSWRVGKSATLTVEIVGKHGRTMAHGKLALRELTGAAALPAGLLRRLTPGRYTAVLQAKAGASRSAIVRAAFTLER